MANFKIMGLNITIEDYLKEFFHTLLPTNRTYDFFVDWEKVFNNIDEIRIGLSLWDSLTSINVNMLEEKMEYLFTNYPESRKVIPILFALRLHEAKRLEILDDPFELKVITYDIENSSPKELVYLIKKIGLFEIIPRIKSFIDYVTGIEVGLDTNARKGRSGKIFETITHNFLQNFIKDSNLMIISHPRLFSDTKSSIKKKKTLDFGIIKKDKIVMAIEVNFYFTSGSKPSEIVRAYRDVQRTLKAQGIFFMWITDGPGWISSGGELAVSFNDIDFPLNLYQLRKYGGKIFNEISKL